MRYLLDGSTETFVLLGVIILQTNLQINALQELPLFLGWTFQNCRDAFGQNFSGNLTENSDIIVDSERRTEDQILCIYLILMMWLRWELGKEGWDQRAPAPAATARQEGEQDWESRAYFPLLLHLTIEDDICRQSEISHRERERERGLVTNSTLFVHQSWLKWVIYQLILSELS